MIVFVDTEAAAVGCTTLPRVTEESKRKYSNGTADNDPPRPLPPLRAHPGKQEDMRIPAKKHKGTGLAESPVLSTRVTAIASPRKTCRGEVCSTHPGLAPHLPQELGDVNVVAAQRVQVEPVLPELGEADLPRDLVVDYAACSRRQSQPNPWLQVPPGVAERGRRQNDGGGGSQ